MNIQKFFSPKKTLSEKRIKFIFWTILPLSSLNGMAVDLMAPALPAIATTLHVSSSAAKNLIALYLLGYALGNFCSGFLIDALGRKHILRTTLLGVISVSLLPAIFPNINILLLSRFLQGIMLGSIAVNIRAIASDILPPEKLVRMGTFFGSMYGVGTVIGPLLGGYLQFYGGWKACFLFFAVAPLISFLAVMFILPETHFDRHPLKLKTIHSHLSEVFHHRGFMGFVLIMGAVYSLMIAFNTVGPFLIQTRLHYTPLFFGKTALCLGATFLGATFVCRYFLKKYHLQRLLFVMIHAVFLIVLLSLFLSIFFGQSLLLLIGTNMVLFFATGFLFPMCMGAGMTLFRHISGTASATMFLINILMTSATAFLLSLVSIQSVSAMIIIDVVLMALCVLVYWMAFPEKS